MNTIIEVAYMGLRFEAIEKFKSIEKVGVSKYQFTPVERNKYIFSVDQRENGKKVIKNFVDWVEKKYPHIASIGETNKSTVLEYLCELKDNLNYERIASSTKENKINLEMSILNKIFSFELKNEDLTPT